MLVRTRHGVTRAEDTDPGPESRALPDPRVCERARLSRDPRFDGLFVIALTTSGIYCRPVCPIRRGPRREHLRYYPTPAAAEAEGFRACGRCRPELPPGGSWSRGDETVARALQLIEEGFLAERPLSALAEHVGVGERHLRRMFIQRLGATPPSLHQAQRLGFAKQLLTETSLPIIEVALEAGFGSVRRFNACFRDAYRMAPRDVRRSRRPARVRDEVLELHLGYRPPYCFAAQLDFLRRRALPDLELVDECNYARVFGPRDAPGWLRLSAWPGGGHALRLEVHCPRPTRLQALVTRVRRMFDLEADPGTIASGLAEDPSLRPLVERAPGLRLPGGWDGFEVAVRCVLAEGSTAAEARASTIHLLERHGQAVELPSAPGLSRLFPGPGALADADLTGLGLVPDLAATVRAIARALLEGRLDFRADRTLEDFVARWSALPGVGARTAHAIALSALGHPDAFPTGRTFLRRGARGDRFPRLRARALAERHERWRPWRAYAVMHLLASTSLETYGRSA
jgi:AraC family transcriptional regulator of adaptative response / DNA-3-methyladenine glycosylase II